MEDIFTRLNLLNKSLQGRFTTVVNFIDKIRSLIMKLDLWEGKTKDGNLYIFENLTTEVGSEKLDTETIRLVKPHLSYLRAEFQSYFPDLSELNVTLISKSVHYISPFSSQRGARRSSGICERFNRKRCI